VARAAQKRLRHYEALTSWRREFCGVGQVWCGVEHACLARRGVNRSRPNRQETGLLAGWRCRSPSGWPAIESCERLRSSTALCLCLAELLWTLLPRLLCSSCLRHPYTGLRTTHDIIRLQHRRLIAPPRNSTTCCSASTIDRTITWRITDALTYT
jgi:hypothetical protein